MATRNLSPGGALLRSSRLFAIPAPLPRPTAGSTANAAGYNSETATLPYPTHLTITTPPSSLSKGDWGLKRSLPLRSTTKTSTPLLRVQSIDTIEHVTEYGSAADHTLTLHKWQEMNMPLSTPTLKDASTFDRKPGRGVFEEDLSASSDGAFNPTKDENRWKFQGPWLAGLSDGEFNEYVQKTVHSRKSEFQIFLREKKALEDTKSVQQKAAEEGRDPPPHIKPSDITPEQLRMFVRELRQDRGALFRLIRMFLDLPPTPSPNVLLSQTVNDSFSVRTDTDTRTRTINSEEFLSKSNSPYAETGPPKTHPSAGLSYLRTKRYIYNHPIYGPQEQPPPIEGRIVMPRVASLGNFAPKLGIAGVVTDTPMADSFSTSERAKNSRIGTRAHKGLFNIELDKLGGSKVYLQPRAGSIDPNGRIDLRVDAGEGPALAIVLGQEDRIFPRTSHTLRPIRPLPRPPNLSQQGYGLESREANTSRIDAIEGERNNGSFSDSSASSRLSVEAEAMNALQNLLERGDDGY